MVARKKPVAAAVNTSTSTEERQALHSSLDELLDKSPTRARLVIAFVASFCSGVAFGWLASTAIEFLTISALVFTGSAFLAGAIWLLGWIAAVYLFIMHMPNVGQWIIERGPDQAWVKAKSFFAEKKETLGQRWARSPNFIVH